MTAKPGRISLGGPAPLSHRLWHRPAIRSAHRFSMMIILATGKPSPQMGWRSPRQQTALMWWPLTGILNACPLKQISLLRLSARYLPRSSPAIISPTTLNPGPGTRCSWSAITAPAATPSRPMQTGTGWSRSISGQTRPILILKPRPAMPTRLSPSICATIK